MRGDLPTWIQAICALITTYLVVRGNLPPGGIKIHPQWVAMMGLIALACINLYAFEQRRQEALAEEKTHTTVADKPLPLSGLSADVKVQRSLDLPFVRLRSTLTRGSGAMEIFDSQDRRPERSPRALIQTDRCSEKECGQFSISISNGDRGMTVRFGSEAEFRQFLASGQIDKAS